MGACFTLQTIKREKTRQKRNKGGGKRYDFKINSMFISSSRAKNETANTNGKYYGTVIPWQNITGTPSKTKKKKKKKT